MWSNTLFFFLTLWADNKQALHQGCSAGVNLWVKHFTFRRHYLYYTYVSHVILLSIFMMFCPDDQKVYLPGPPPPIQTDLQYIWSETGRANHNHSSKKGQVWYDDCYRSAAEEFLWTTKMAAADVRSVGFTNMTVLTGQCTGQRFQTYSLHAKVPHHIWAEQILENLKTGDTNV